MKAAKCGIFVPLIAVFAALAIAAPSSVWGQGITPKRPDSPGGWNPTTPKSPGGAKSGEQLVKVTSLANVAEIAPGVPFHLAFLFDIEPGWHIYWKNSGDSGAPTEIKVTGPAGFVIGPVQFPRPTAFAEPEGTVYGYADRVALFVQVTTPAEMKIPPVAVFRAEIDWLVCKDICLMGSAAQSITIPVSVGAATAAEHRSEIDKFKARLPKSIRNGQDGVEISASDDELVISMASAGFDDAQFFPFDTPGITYGAAQVSTSEGRLTLRIPIEVNPNNAGENPLAAGGLIGFGRNPDDLCFEFSHPLSAP
jgi:thiol:disulfide interchange protein DsbD